MSASQKRSKQKVSQICAFGVPKKNLHGAARQIVTSQGTARICRQSLKNFLEDREARGVALDAPVLRSELQEYLLLGSTQWRQSTLDQARQMLSKIYCVELPRYKACIATHTDSRAYSRDQVAEIISHLSARNALAVEVAFAAGLRASELYELRETSQLQPHARPWGRNLFLGLEPSVICVTTGKGGLRRPLAIPNHLFERVASCKLQTPRRVVDRGIARVAHFDIGGGQNLSQAFSTASKQALGFSHGFHGLRHSFAQNRFAALIDLGLATNEALSAVSQILGHFRIDITLVYLVSGREK